MIDLRPVGYVIGLLVAVLGAAMLVPMGVDWFDGNGHAWVFLQSAVLTVLVGGSMAISCANGAKQRITIQQTFLITTGVWVALPIFGAIPFWLGATEARVVDAFFEAMSGLTTTGATVFVELEALPHGLLFWRGLLQWIGGIGIIVVAMVFLPELRIGGMQIFRSEGFDTFGKILPRAGQISARISVVYLTLTIACGLAYLGFGMEPFDAIVHAMTTIATGGFANYDLSFATFGAGVEYAATLFMILAALPFVRYVQLLSGSGGNIFADAQVRGFLILIVALSAMLVAWLWITTPVTGEQGFRKALFNGVSILTGTGYVSADYMLWGAFPVALLFFAGLIGGCAGSTSCSIKVFRYQILVSSVASQLQSSHSPHGVFHPRYDGRPIDDEVLSSVMAFFVLFLISLGITAVLLGATGLDAITSVSAAAAGLANIGPGLGDIVGPTGSYAPLSDPAKWLLAVAMLVGRLELMVVYAILTLHFWRA